MHIRALGILVLTCLPTYTALADVRLQSDSDISIREEGDFDTASGWLTELLDQTIGNILKEHGIEPAPDRKRQTSWKVFLTTHWDVLASIDFTTIEVWTTGGLVAYYLLFVMELKTRRVHLAACKPTLGDDFMKQVARNLTDPFDGFLQDKRYILMDRDASFSAAFHA